MGFWEASSIHQSASLRAVPEDFPVQTVPTGYQTGPFRPSQRLRFRQWAWDGASRQLLPSQPFLVADQPPNRPHLPDKTRREVAGRISPNSRQGHVRFGLCPQSTDLVGGQVPPAGNATSAGSVPAFLLGLSPLDLAVVEAGGLHRKGLVSLWRFHFRPPQRW